MKRSLLIISCLSLVLSKLHAESAGTFRPALVGSGPKSLINLIDTKKLMAARQKDAVVMFSCVIPAVEGNRLEAPGIGVFTYRETPGAKALRAEVVKKCEQARFIPAVYEGKPVPVLFSGTVLFSVVNGAPHLRIFANQDSEGMMHGSDFVAPQLIIGTENWPAAAKELQGVARTGAAELKISTDANGNVTGISVLWEDPKGFNFGHASRQEYQHARFVPGFRNGKPVACSFTFTNLVSMTITWRTRYR